MPLVRENARTAGVSVRLVEDITEALWGTRVSPGGKAEFISALPN